jgi:hypothetical protein
MSSLWTPSGEHFPEKEPADASRSSLADADDTEPSPEEAQAAMEAMRAQLAQTPADVVIANHCYGLFELAAIYLSQTPPVLFQARLAIDALGAVLDGLAGRLGEAEPQLRESLSQLRLAFVSLEGAEQAGAQSAAAGESGSGASPN